MNQVALYLASGESLYLGAALLLLAITASPYLSTQWQFRARNILSWFAIAMMAMASPAFPLIVDAVFVLVFLFWIGIWNRPRAHASVPMKQVAVGLMLALLTVALAVSEGLHRRMPSVSGAKTDHIVVIGDSISAGIDPKVPSWPKVFQQTAGIPVKNLALPGSQVSGGPFMAGKLTSGDQVVVIELGGNDLLNNVSSDSFEHDLSATLAKLAEPGRTLVMFELPLLPHETAYGQIQRRLAAKYHVWLIPKRKFVEVIRGADATSDGIHLAPLGTHRMAALVAEVLKPVLPSTPLN